MGVEMTTIEQNSRYATLINVFTVEPDRLRIWLRFYTRPPRK